MDWDKLRIFHAVGMSKSLTKAGEVLNVSQSAVSRQISALEEKMGIPLFHRHARGLMLTEQGEILFRTVSEMVAKLQQTEIALTEASIKPKGPYKLTVPATFGTLWLSAQMKEFTDLYPEIDVTLICEDRELDLTTREADAAIRFHPAKHPDLVQVPIMRLRNALYASNDYLHERGVPKTVAEMAQHKLLVPTLTPEEAAGLVCEAIIHKPVRVASRLGIFGQTLHALVPRVAQIIMNTTFRMFPDSEAAKKKSAAEQSGEQPSADQVAFQQVMRGIYF